MSSLLAGGRLRSLRRFRSQCRFLEKEMVMNVGLSAGESSLGTHLVERLRRSKLLSEEPSDNGNTNGDAVPFLDLGRTGQSTVDQSGTGLSTVCRQGERLRDELGND